MGLCYDIDPMKNWSVLVKIARKVILFFNSKMCVSADYIFHVLLMSNYKQERLLKFKKSVICFYFN